MNRIYACSTNPGKLREFVLAARESGVSTLIVEPLPGLNEIPPPEETGSTFAQNASLKALYYSKFTRESVLADDSGLEVRALGGAPGIHSARYAGAGATHSANNEFLLRRLEGQTDRNARFVCVIALARKGKLLYTAEGTVNGEILEAPVGTHGFGYDPLFHYPPLKRSFGELLDGEKFLVSARGHALRAILNAVSSARALH